MKTVIEDLEKGIKFFVKLSIPLCILILLVPLLLRLNEPLAGDEAYHHLRLANVISNQGLVFYDKLNNKEIFPEFGWPITIAYFSKLFNNNLVLSINILLLILGVLSFILFYLLVKDIEYIRGMSSLFLLLSPGFLYLFSISNNYAMVIFLTLFSIFFYKRNKFISVLAFALLPLFSLGSFISLIIILYYLLKIDKVRDWVYYFVVFILVSLSYLPFFLRNGIRLDNFFNVNIIYDFGIFYGIGIFLGILALFGLAELWKNKYNYKWEYLFVFILIILSFYFSSVLFYLSFVFAVLASFGFFRVLKRRWENEFLHLIMLMIVFCGVLFSGVAYFKEFKEALPNQDIIDGLISLRNVKEVIFSSPEYGNWISWSGNKNVADTNYPVNKYASNDIKKVYASYAYDEDIWIMDSYSTKYVFLDKNIRTKLTEQGGLLFLLKYDKRFKKVYSKNDVEIWEYIK